MTMKNEKYIDWECISIPNSPKMRFGEAILEKNGVNSEIWGWFRRNDGPGVDRHETFWSVH